ncbi:MAG: CPBP family glutamic-type intramembrane protease [Candidatus Hydrogenedens sp.]
MNIKIILVVLFSLNFLLELCRNFFQIQKLTTIVKIIQSLLLICAIFYLFIQQILPRNLFFVPNWIVGLVLGHILYTIGFLITVGFNSIVKNQFLSFLQVFRFSFLSPVLLGKTFTVALTEEIIYRATIQPILIGIMGSPAIAILIVSLTFTLVHEHIFQNQLRQNIEFLIFSIIISILYHVTNDLGFVTILHFIRNMESNYLEYLDKLQEINDPDKCMDELERTLFEGGGVS